eukprot:7261222-Pyramimonas_sp.AAC.1
MTSRSWLAVPLSDTVSLSGRASPTKPRSYNMCTPTTSVNNVFVKRNSHEGLALNINDRFVGRRGLFGSASIAKFAAQIASKSTRC